MNQQGFIIEIVDEKTAKLKMQKHSACASCGKCATTSESKDIIVEVDNSIGARVGDHVEVNMDTVKVMKATAIAYILPLISLLVGTIATYYVLGFINIVNGVEIISGAVGLIATGATYLYIRQNDKKYRESRDYIPRITRILI